MTLSEEDKSQLEEFKKELEEKESELKGLEEGYNTEEYEEMLNDSYEPFKMGDLTYYPADILKNCDEIAFNCGLNDYNSEKIDDLNGEIKELREQIAELEKEEISDLIPKEESE